MLCEIISKNKKLTKKQVSNLFDVLTRQSEISFEIVGDDVKIICCGETQIEKLTTDELAEKVISIWNAKNWELKSLKKFSVQRMVKFKKLLKDRPELSTIEEWEEIISRIDASNFLQGDNDRNWRADFEWLLQKDSIDKLYDGRYDNRDGLSRTVKAALALYKQQAEC